eukprot:6432220-Pyramimonas_sp.AAC.1
MRSQGSVPLGHIVCAEWSPQFWVPSSGEGVVCIFCSALQLGVHQPSGQSARASGFERRPR